MQGVAFMLVEAKLALHAADLIEFTPVLIGGQRSLVIRHQLVEPITLAGQLAAEVLGLAQISRHSGRDRVVVTGSQ